MTKFNETRSVQKGSRKHKESKSQNEQIRSRSVFTAIQLHHLKAHPNLNKVQKHS